MAFLSKGNEPRGLRLFTTGSSLVSGGLGAQTIPGVSTAAQSLALVLSANESFVELARERIFAEHNEAPLR